MAAPFLDRRDAGRRLAKMLRHYTDHPDVIILALPRGGVPVAYEVARELHAPLDVFVVRKLGVPGHEELALGAIASGGVRVLNQDVVEAIGISDPGVDAVADRELAELERQEACYRGAGTPIDVEGRVAIIVDDGLATGATMRAAAKALRSRGVGRIVVAVPIAPVQ